MQKKLSPTGTEEGVCFSGSELSEYQECPRKYYFKYLKSIEPKQFMGIPRPVGTAVHAGVATIYKGKPLYEAVQAALDTYDEAVAPYEKGPEDEAKVDDGRQQVRLSVSDYPYKPGDVEEVVDIEGQLVGQVVDDRWLVGRVDRVIKSAGFLWVHDTKTSGLPLAKIARVYRIRHQFAGYVWLVRKLKELPVVGVMMDFIGKPRINKKRDGTYSSTSPATYVREPHHKSEWDLQQFEDWFRRVTTDIIVDTEIVEATSKPRWTAFPQNTGACFNFNSICPYFELCAAGDRWDELAGAKYQERKEHNLLEQGGDE